MPNDSESWDEYRKLILRELERLDEDLKELSKDNKDSNAKYYQALSKVREEIVALKVKAGVWGILGGVVTTLGAVLLKFV